MVSSDGIGDGTCLFGFGSHLSQSLVISEAKGNHQKCRSIEFFPKPKPFLKRIFAMHLRHSDKTTRHTAWRFPSPTAATPFSTCLALPAPVLTKWGSSGRKQWQIEIWCDTILKPIIANNYSSTCKKAGNPPKSSNIYGWPSLWRARTRTIIWVLHVCGHTDRSWHNIKSYCSTNTSRISKTHTRTRTFFAHQSETGATAGLCGLLLHNHENNTSNY